MSGVDSTRTVEVRVLETGELGDRSYVAHDGEVAVVVDPQRDLDRLAPLLEGLRVVAVLETHVHNDYVSGGLALARASGSDYLVNAADPVEFDRDAVADGDERALGSLRIRVVATPGHTATHLAYLVTLAGSDGPGALFTGGSLLFGSVGRTDLLGADRTDELTRAQWHSARALAALPGDTRVYPTHGFGSFCSSAPTDGAEVGDFSTVTTERGRNIALLTDDEDAFVDRLVAGLTAYPAYYAHMGARNLAGAGPVDLSAPAPVAPDELRKRLAAREWVVDLRERRAYAAEHLDGTVSLELGPQLATNLGWLVPWGVPLTLLGGSAEEVAAAQRQLVRIGIDRPDAAAVGTPGELADDAEQLVSHPVRSFDDLAGLADRSTVSVLDVRRDDERAESQVTGSVHVPLHELLVRGEEVPRGREVWVHCRSGLRAGTACSLLARAGHRVVHVDDTYDRAEELGLTRPTP